MTRVTVDDGMMISAVRYALGRATYIVWDTCREVRAVWSDCSENTRRVIRRDVEDALPTGPQGTSIDDDEWRSLLQWITTQEGPR